jgi:1,4-dihydroxy-2-naphthoate octaprenyltransferase
VFLGRRLARYQYVLFMAGAYVSAAALFLVGSFSGWTLLSWLSIPAAISPIVAVLTRVEGPPLNAALRATARLHFIFAMLLAIGLTQ